MTRRAVIEVVNDLCDLADSLLSDFNKLTAAERRKNLQVGVDLIRLRLDVLMAEYTIERDRCQASPMVEDPGFEPVDGT